VREQADDLYPEEALEASSQRERKLLLQDKGRTRFFFIWINNNLFREHAGISIVIEMEKIFSLGIT